MSLIKKVVSYGLFPAVFVGAIGAAVIAMQKGIEGAWIVLIISVATGLITLIFERILPYSIEWNKAKNDVKTDIMHAIISMMLIPKALEIVLTASLLTIALEVSNHIGFDIWPSHLPLILQLVIAMLITQFFEYWIHRGLHEVPLLWRLHATHHSPKRLYWLNAARFHPIDTFLNFSVSFSVMLLLGVNAEILVLSTVWTSVHGMFQHCNINIKLGWLNYIFSMAELHRWHHSLKLEEANTNYGSNIIFWDIVFGTMYYPKNKEASDIIGLHDTEAFPENYLGQLVSPFNWEKINQQNSID